MLKPAKFLHLLFLVLAGLALSACSKPVDQSDIKSGITPTPPPGSIIRDKPSDTEVSKYPWHSQIVATVFWVGERPSSANDFITNKTFAWTADIVASFGGVDSPNSRNPDIPYYPDGFTPLQNPFYVALPAQEFDQRGLIASARPASPWTNSSTPGSFFKNRWVEVVSSHKSGQEFRCFGQWEDVGPGGREDSLMQYDYVFGTARPDNSLRLGAGIDISPACAIALGMDIDNLVHESGIVSWRFTDPEDVPPGPWKNIITTAGPQW